MIGVIGATGTVGTHLIRELVARGEHVVAVSRGQAKPPGSQRLQYATADVLHPPSLTEALRGARAVFLLVSGEASGKLEPGAVLGAIEATGAERVVLLSSLAARSRPASPAFAPLRELERASTKTQLHTTVLAPTGFASNSLAWAPAIQAQRHVAAPSVDVALPVVAPEDVAAVAAITLCTDGHRGATYMLTGPSPVTPRQQIDAIAAAIEAPIALSELGCDEAAEAMRAFMPAPVVTASLEILCTPNALERSVSPDVERLLGRPGTSFATWAARHADAFR